MEERPIAGPDAATPVLSPPDLSPEARRREALRRRDLVRTASADGGPIPRAGHALAPRARLRRVLTRVFTGVWNDGFIHAGNLAYMAVVALFPFFITAAAIFSALGERDDRAAMINAFLLAVPPAVARAVAPVAHDVVEARADGLLWIGGLVGLWTVGSLIETIRDVLRRAYGTRATRAFWRNRLGSSGIIIAAVVALLLSLIAQVVIGAVEQAILVWVPRLEPLTHDMALSRLIPAVVLFGSIYLLFLSLTPTAYRGPRYPKWPGAAFVTAWWVGVTISLPWALRRLLHYDAIYGSLAGIMITLFFFWLVGLGMVLGAELNAALAETPEEQDLLGQDDNSAHEGGPRHGVAPRRRNEGGD
ncbi:YihY/virulence factor BrkB family protein [Novosphingobium piscinae]|uniref:YihY/virulence factor BrkB family protein n=1 Tax=Novosphingobium piscinae TaxID=1507448 RepID=A0A7X1G191_9SPHN|nr:YihY/virulence factor BrkB family protein [Novosphingobium piscinae]MBC2670805.1 YihY/virulence factor BrkB family protein [Novosphingobium piscinae]